MEGLDFLRQTHNPQKKTASSHFEKGDGEERALMILN